MTPSDILEANAVAANNRTGLFDDLPLTAWEQGDLLEIVSNYTATFKITAEVGAFSLQAVGLYYFRKLIEVTNIGITSYSEF